jgi:hypothetical protein
METSNTESNEEVQSTDIHDMVGCEIAALPF